MVGRYVLVKGHQSPLIASYCSLGVVFYVRQESATFIIDEALVYVSSLWQGLC